MTKTTKAPTPKKNSTKTAAAKTKVSQTSAAAGAMSRSLGSLATSLRQNDSTQRVVDVPVDQIGPVKNVRSRFDPKKHAELTASVKAEGVIQPIRIYPSGVAAPAYYIRFGERRWRAATAAGLPTIPAIIGDPNEADDQSRLTQQLTENMHREDMVLIDTVVGVSQLVRASSNADAAKALGMPKGWISKMVSIGSAGGIVAEVMEADVTRDAEAIYLLATLQKKDPKAARALGRRWIEDGADRARSAAKAAHDALAAKPKATSKATATVPPDGGTSGDRPASPTEQSSTAGQASAKPAPKKQAADAGSTLQTKTTTSEASRVNTPPAAKQKSEATPRQSETGEADAADGPAMTVEDIRFTSTGGAVVTTTEGMTFHFDNSLLAKLDV